MTRPLLKTCTHCHRQPRPGKSTCATCAMAAARNQRRRYAERREAGVCITCAKAPPVVRDRCQGCHDRRASYPSTGRNATHEARARLSLCRDCGEVEVFEQTRCEACKQAMADDAKRRREERKAEGRCISCLRKAMKDRARCRVCLAKRRATWADYVPRRQQQAA